MLRFAKIGINKYRLLRVDIDTPFTFDDLPRE